MNETQEQQLIELLSLIDPKKPLGKKLFDDFARVIVSVAIEAVGLRHNPLTKETEVFMTQRPMDDTAYPGMWHCPGSVLRPGESFNDALKRLEEQEFGGRILYTRFLAPVNIPNEARGHFVSLVYRCNVSKGKQAPKGVWFAVTDLPAETVPSHRNIIIPLACKSFFG